MSIPPDQPALRELQRCFERCLLEALQPSGDEAGAESLLCQVRTALEPAAALPVYRNTSLTTLTNALGLSFPVVRKLVGADFFAAAAQCFICAQPPTSAYLNDYGGEFAQFLRGYRPAEELTYLPEVAELEWAVSRALHAPDRARLDPARLAQVGVSDLGQVALVPHPSLSALHFRYPVDRVWHAVLEQDEAAMGAIDLSDGPIWLLVERDREDLLQVRRVRPPVGEFLTRLYRSEPVETALADSIAASADEKWHEVLAEQFAAGRLVDFELKTTMAPGSIPDRPRGCNCEPEVFGGYVHE